MSKKISITLTEEEVAALSRTIGFYIRHNKSSSLEMKLSTKISNAYMKVVGKKTFFYKAKVALINDLGVVTRNLVVTKIPLNHSQEMREEFVRKYLADKDYDFDSLRITYFKYSD